MLNTKNAKNPQIHVHFIWNANAEYPVQIDIEDNGSGIPTEQLKQIFEPFFTTKTKGTGLGLAICRRVIEAHNGVLQASQATLGGARFSIAIPLKTST